MKTNSTKFSIFRFSRASNQQSVFQNFVSPYTQILKEVRTFNSTINNQFALFGKNENFLKITHS